MRKSLCRCWASKKPWMLLCRTCWRKLPVELRAEVWASYREAPNSQRHTAAIRRCLEHLDGLKAPQPASA